MFELVIFDCDGVLVDSERISCGMLAEALTEVGLPMDLQRAVELFMGRSNRDSIRMTEEMLGRPLPTGFREQLEARKHEQFRQRLEAITGVESVLENLDCPVCVASSGTHERMGVTLGVTGLLRYFEDRIFSATEVVNGKPAPDLFLHAAQRMDVDPDRCAVVEDSVPGTRAGIAAGMTVFGFSDLVPADRLRDAGARTFKRMSDLLPLLQPRT